MTRIRGSTQVVCKNHFVTMTFIKVLRVNLMVKTLCHVDVYLHSRILFPLEISVLFIFSNKISRINVETLHFLMEGFSFPGGLCSMLLSFPPDFQNFKNNSSESGLLPCPVPSHLPPLPALFSPPGLLFCHRHSSLIFLKLSGILFLKFLDAYGI